MTEPLPYREQLALIRNGMAEKTTKAKPKTPIAKVSPKRQKEIADEKEKGSDSEMDLFFEEMKSWLNGKCSFCGGRTTWKNKELWRVAIAHLLPKSKFKSIATNVNNWTELCWDCHTDFDTAKITWELLYDSHEWAMLKSQLEIILPLVAPEERKQKLYSKLTELVYGKPTPNPSLT